MIHRHKGRRVEGCAVQRLAIMSAAVGVLLLFLSWLQTYPIEPTTSDPSSVFVAISPLFWIGLMISIPSLLMFGYANDRLQKAIAGSSIFLVFFALSFFFYYPLGSDLFFQTLTTYYFSEGHIVSSYQTVYPWPVFFILAKELELVTSLPTRILEHFFILIMGMLIPLGVFLIAERRRINAVAASFAFTVFSFYFIDFQFVSQTLALALLMLLLASDYHIPASRSKTVAQILIFISICFAHAFLPVFYLAYLGSKYVFGRKETGQVSTEAVQRNAVVTLLGIVVIYITVFVYYVNCLYRAVIGLRQSIDEALGRASYSAMFNQTVAKTSDTVIQTLSRTTLIATAMISVSILILMFFRKELSQKDQAVGASGLVYLLAGYSFLILGERALQMLAVAASVPVGYFGGMHRKWPAIGLLTLAVTSVSMPMHLSFSLGSGYWRDPAAAQAATFVASHLGTAVTDPIFLGIPSFDILTFLVMNNSGLSYGQLRTILYSPGGIYPEAPGFTSKSETARAHAPYAYLEDNTGIERDIRLGIAGPYTPEIGALPNSANYNRVVDYGSGRWNMYVRWQAANAS